MDTNVESTVSTEKHLNIKLFAIGGLICLIFLQCLLIVYCGFNKSGYYGDEVATYLLANDSKGGFLQFHEDAINHWVDGNYYSELMTMENNNRFDFSVPYHNQEIDVHPPLYYFVVHFACSLFPNGDWKWIGLGINIFLSLVLSIFIFLLARRITCSYGISLLTVAGYILSLGFINTITFLRMYTMLTMWCVIFAWLLTGLIQNIHSERKIKFRTYIGLFLITFCGILTQYYFLIFSFFLCLSVFIYMLIKKQWKTAGLFTVSEFGGIGCSVAFFPAMLTHIFAGYRGTDAINSALDFTDYFSNLTNIFSIFNKEMFGNLFIPIAIVLFLLTVSAYIISKVQGYRHSYCQRHMLLKRKMTFLREGWTCLLFVSCLSYVLVIVDISPFITDRYYMCLYPFFTFFFILSVYDILSVFISNRLHTYMIVLCCIVLISGHAWFEYSTTYLWSFIDTDGIATSREEILSDYNQYPSIIVDFTCNHTFMHGLVYDWQKSAMVYHFYNDTYEDLIDVLRNSDLQNGFLLYIVNKNYSLALTTLNPDYIGINILNTLSESYPMSYEMILTNGDIDIYFCLPE